jgi:RNA-directed DNA polymerase
MALEPQLEVLMVQQAPDAYGFRPGRWRGDAAKALRNYLDKAEGRYVAVCDIEKCFDRLDHDWVLQRIETWPTMQCYLREVLRAGYMEDGRWHPSERGAPQGGPLSGLITNWALLGLEQYVSGHLRPGQRPGIIRYADDIRIVHQDPQVLQRAIQLVEEYLIPIGLNLHPGKTEIVSVRDGVAFLGYTLRQFARSPQQKKSRNGFITLVSPSKESQKRHYAKLARIVGYHNAKSQEKLIEDLNPVIRGWAQSYADMNASQTFSRLDHLLFVRLRRWAKRRHGNKSQAWLRGKYFNGGRPWVFKPTGPNAPRLAKHSETKIRPRAKVPKGYSPYDRSGWLRKSHPLALRYAELGKDISEVWEDLREEDIAYSSEEPCEVKVSRTVLKTSAGQEASTEFNAKKSY